MNDYKRNSKIHLKQIGRMPVRKKERTGTWSGLETKESQKQAWDDEDVIDVGEILYALLRKLWIIIGALVIGGAIGGAYSYFLLTPQYTSTAKIYVLTKETTLTSLADLQIGTQLTQDYKTIITGRSVMEEVVDKLHLDMDYKNLVKKIEVENPKDTRILSISAQDPDAEMAKKIVDTTAEVASDYVGEIMEMTPPKLIESGEVAVKKTSPSNTKNAAIGALIAAFLVCAYISLTVILNDTIQSEEDVEKYLELPVLAVIPESKIHGRGEKKVKRTSGIWDIINPFAGKEKNERR